MKRVLIAAAVLSLVVAAAAFAADSGQAPKGQSMSFEERKADILKHLDTRMSFLQEETACVQAARNHDDLKACRQKHHAEMDQMRGEYGKGGHMGGPGGMGGPGYMGGQPPSQ
jgi:hypothetical protein